MMSFPTRYLLVFYSLFAVGCTHIDSKAHKKLINDLKNQSSVEQDVTDTSIDTDDTSTPDLDHDYYILFDRDNSDAVSFERDEVFQNVLSWQNSWTVSVLFATTEASGVLLSRGENWIGFRSEGKENGEREDFFYLGNGQEVPPVEIRCQFGDPYKQRFTFVFQTNANETRNITVYRNQVLIYNQEFEVDFYDDFFASNVEGGEVFIGRNENLSFDAWSGGLDQMMIMEQAITEDEIESLLTTNDWEQLLVFDKFQSWWKMGDEDYPHVQDQKDVAPGSMGSLSETSFMAYEDE